jgi:hypothetical protein
MKRSISKILLSAVVSVGAATAVCAYVPSAEAQVVYYPTPAYVASYRPVYYNGYAHYYYNNAWYYRDHYGWHGYAHEPGYLYGQRGGWGSHYYRWR